MTDTADVLTAEAQRFLIDLQREFGARRVELLARRAERLERLHAGELPDFLPETADVRESATGASHPTPAEIADRRVEITGPVDRKMVINALNSGRAGLHGRLRGLELADLGELHRRPAQPHRRARPDDLARHRGEAVHAHRRPGGALRAPARLASRRAALRGRRPRRCPASLFDFGLYFFRNHGRNGRYLYLPKLESHLEARLWNDVFVWSQERLGVPHGTIKATVLIETILAAFEMDEILYELRDHSAGLNAGRWDYIFSVIKKLGHRPEMVLPDRGAVTMAVPFMRSYCELLVKTCHRRGAFAMGGMAAFIPSRRDAEVNAVALAKVREDKEREASQGFDGTWVAHPDLVPTAYEAFDAVLGDRPNQIDRQRDDVTVDGGRPPGHRRDARRGDRGRPPEQRLRRDPVPRGLAPGLGRGRDQQPDGGRGDGRDQPLPDLAVASPRPLHRRATCSGSPSEEMDALGPGYDEARAIFESIATRPDYVEFLTLPAYDRLVAADEA